METNIEKAIRLLNNAEVISFPTETLYGIGCRIDNEESVDRIFELKNREDKPLQMLFANKDMVNEYAIVDSDLEQRIIDEFMPGSITLLLKKKNNVSDKILCGSPFIGARIPDNSLILEVLGGLDVPICATSANLSGEPACLNADDVKNVFGDKIPFVLDGGECVEKVGSTVLTVQDGEIKIFREGPITKKMILDRLGLDE